MSKDIYEGLLEEYQRLRRNVDRNGPQPANEAERRSKFVLDHYDIGIAGLFCKGVAPDIVEDVLLYHWLHWVTINYGLGDEKFETLTADLDTVRGLLGGVLRRMGEKFEDEGPTPEELRKLGDTIQMARDIGASIQRVSAIQQPSAMSYEERHQQADFTNREIIRLTRECLATAASSVLIESAFLYHWARVSTINFNVPESFFQKLEHHWLEVLEGVDRFIKGL
jgi:hypothetical protein